MAITENKHQTTPINTQISISDFLILINKSSVRVADYLRKNPLFPHTKVNSRVYICNLVLAFEFHNNQNLDPKAEYQVQLNRKIKLEADLLEDKKAINEQSLVDPIIAIQQIQREYAFIKDKLCSLKQLLLNKCENKSLKELDVIFTEHTRRTLEGLSTQSKMERLLKETE